MIICRICGDTCGPWAYYENFGFVCEDCIEEFEKNEWNNIKIKNVSQPREYASGETADNS